MHLKELSLYGFKSFGDRVKIEFNPHLTAIVGPNGSGKSNIVDSVRWLLGDQSYKSLRVPSSEEVIFKGSDQDAAFNFSHVGMVMDLGEEGEIQVERKFHRSGENEYILNGKTVRLKDIRTLLSSMGFGLGSLSILSQGQIDSILSLVPADRRIVLEEVAQIAHFKDNKSRILKKLDSTRDNLTRLDDILKEVEGRLEELAEQSEAARKFRELSHLRADLELALSFKETERLVKSIRRNLDELQNKESDLFDLRNEQTDLKIELANIERLIDDLRTELDEELRLVKEKSLEVEKTRSAVELAQKELDACVERRQNGRRSIHRLELEIENIQEQIVHEQQNLSQSIEDKSNAHSELSKALSRNKELLENEEKELERISQRETLISKAQNDIDLAIGQKSMLYDRLSRANQYLEEGEEAFTDKSSEIHRIENRIASITKDANALAEQTTEKDTLRTDTQKQIADSAMQIETLEKNASVRKDELIRTASELKILKDLENRLAGFNTAVKRLIEAHRSGSLTGIVGPVVDLIKVETGFEKAVESALGSRSQYVVVETFHDGLNALEHIKKSGGGRATFIPMEDFSGSAHSVQLPEITKNDGFLGRVIDRLTVDDRFKPVLENLLGNALIFDTLQSARNARKKHNLRQWIVTLDGDVHRPDGIFSGGSAESGNDGPLVRRSQISELESKKGQFEKDLNDLNSKLSAERNVNRDAENTLKQVDRELSELKEDASGLSRESYYLIESLTNLERELVELRGRTDKIEKEIKEIGFEISTVDETISSLESQLDKLTDPENNDNELK
jgi:chromosome segregation protein